MITGYVDSHCHFFESMRVAQWVKDTCDIWEYGEVANVQLSAASGTLQDLLSAMSVADVSRAVVVNCFSIDEWRDRAFNGLHDGLNLSGNTTAMSHSLLARMMMGYNEWILQTVTNVPEIVPFVAIDPWVLSHFELDNHLSLVTECGAKGAKIHPVAQRIDFRHEGSLGVVRLAASHGLPLVIHSGKAKGSIPFGEITSLMKVAKTPDLRLIIAHLGGATWKQAPAMAEDYPKVLFDISELIAWLGAPNAPTPSELVDIIRQIGPERVMFGSDFPWYDPSEMLQVVKNLPHLSDLELSAIVRDNAVKHLALH